MDNPYKNSGKVNFILVGFLVNFFKLENCSHFLSDLRKLYRFENCINWKNCKKGKKGKKGQEGYIILKVNIF